MKNGGGHFAPELGGHFELESGGHFKLELGGHFKLELGGQYDWNLHIASELYSNKEGKLRSIMCPKCENSDGVDFESFGLICHMCGYNFIID